MSLLRTYDGLPGLAGRLESLSAGTKPDSSKSENNVVDRDAVLVLGSARPLQGPASRSGVRIPEGRCTLRVETKIWTETKRMT